MTHVIVDEVHERSVDSDLLLLLLRDALARHRGLRVVLMSATADPGLFADYFAPALGRLGEAGGVSHVDVPGFTYPVREFFLEDCVEATGFVVGKGSKLARKGAGRGEEVDLGPGYSERTRATMANIAEGAVNYAVLEATLAHVLGRLAAEGEDAFLRGWEEGGARAQAGDASLTGAVLVFLPGVEEIRRVARLLGTSPAVRAAAGAGLEVLPLYGSLPAREQAAVFRRPRPGCRKVVLATNVAETSITIDDCTVVVDTGLAKEMRYDPVADVSRLTLSFVSRASATQRRGRAGRVRPGACFRLFSRSRTWAEGMEEHSSPEMQRAPLLPLCLRVKASVPGASVQATLGQALTPPAPAALEASLAQLRVMGALEEGGAPGEGERLTPLGHVLVRMPVDPHVGKLLVMSGLLGCLEGGLTVAAAMSYGRGLFVESQDRRDAARQWKLRFANGVKSDHWATCEAFRAWEEEARGGGGGRRAAREWCEERCMSEQALENVGKIRRDLRRVLADLGLAGGGGGAGGGATGGGGGGESPRLLAAALCAGFYPKVARVQNPAATYLGLTGLGTAVEKEEERGGRAVKLFLKDRRRVFVHPGSINFSVGKYESPWAVYTGESAGARRDTHPHWRPPPARDDAGARMPGSSRARPGPLAPRPPRPGPQSWSRRPSRSCAR